MEIGDWAGTESLNKTYREIRELGLESSLAEMEAYGFTVIPDAISPELTARLREAVIRVCERRHDAKLDLDNEVTLKGRAGTVVYLLYEDPAFEELVLNREALALANYFVSPGSRIYSLTSHVKGPGGEELQLHADAQRDVPLPWTAYDHLINCNYLLTDYTEEKGALAIVPGSHRQCRPPTPAESFLSGNARNPHAIPIEAPAGSVCIFQGRTWHGSFIRNVPGLRLNLSASYCRANMTPLDCYSDRVPPGFLERHGGRDSRMGQLVGVDRFMGWHEEGPFVGRREKQPNPK